MNVVEDLIAQRDAILFGEWVQGLPGKGQACLVYRSDDGEVCDESAQIIAALVDRHSVRRHRGFPISVFWNDHKGRTRQEVLDVLDEAIRLAKESGLTGD